MLQLVKEKKIIKDSHYTKLQEIHEVVKKEQHKNKKYILSIKCVVVKELLKQKSTKL